MQSRGRQVLPPIPASGKRLGLFSKKYKPIGEGINLEDEDLPELLKKRRKSVSAITENERKEVISNLLKKKIEKIPKPFIAGSVVIEKERKKSKERKQPKERISKSRSFSEVIPFDLHEADLDNLLGEIEPKKIQQNLLENQDPDMSGLERMGEREMEEEKINDLLADLKEYKARRDDFNEKFGSKLKTKDIMKINPFAGATKSIMPQEGLLSGENIFQQYKTDNKPYNYYMGKPVRSATQYLEAYNSYPNYAEVGKQQEELAQTLYSTGFKMGDYGIDTNFFTNGKDFYVSGVNKPINRQILQGLKIGVYGKVLELLRNGNYKEAHATAAHFKCALFLKRLKDAFIAYKALKNELRRKDNPTESSLKKLTLSALGVIALKPQNTDGVSAAAINAGINRSNKIKRAFTTTSERGTAQRISELKNTKKGKAMERRAAKLGITPSQLKNYMKEESLYRKDTNKVTAAASLESVSGFTTWSTMSDEVVKGLTEDSMNRIKGGYLPRTNPSLFERAPEGDWKPERGESKTYDLLNVINAMRGKARRANN